MWEELLALKQKLVKGIEINGRIIKGVPDKQGINFFPEGIEIGEKKRFRLKRNRVRALAKDAYERREVLPFPKFIILEPLNLCNLKCPFCVLTTLTRPVGKMDLDLYYKIIDESSENEVYGLSLYMLGEPFLHPHIREMVVYAKKSDLSAVNLSTNGDVKKLTSILGACIDDLIISIDGFTKSTYEKLRQGAVYERMLERVNEFLRQKVDGRYEHPYVRIQIINMQDTLPEIIPFIEYWLDKPGVNCVFVKDLDGMIPWIGNVFVNKEDEVVKNRLRLPCSQLWKVGNIFWNGDVSACCHDGKGDLVVGNLRNSTLKEVWHSSKMEEYRSRHINGDYMEICQSCTEWDVW